MALRAARVRFQSALFVGAKFCVSDQNLGIFPAPQSLSLHSLLATFAPHKSLKCPKVAATKSEVVMSRGGDIDLVVSVSGRRKGAESGRK